MFVVSKRALLTIFTPLSASCTTPASFHFVYPVLPTPLVAMQLFFLASSAALWSPELISYMGLLSSASTSRSRPTPPLAEATQ